MQKAALLGMGLLVAFLVSSMAAHAGERQWVADDFFVEEGRSGSSLRRDEPLSCRDHIRKIMCLVDPAPGNGEGDPAMNRPCQAGGEAYAEVFEALYDHYPPALQKMFCSLDVLFIERGFFGTAYAGVVKDPSGKITGAKMGIRQSVIDEQLGLAAWASWKEQLSFGARPDSYELVPGLPIVRAEFTAGVNDFLYFVIAHEFGHIFDFANGVNRYKDPGCDQLHDGNCEVHPESWAALSWSTGVTPLPENDVTDRAGLCFYWCEGRMLARSKAPALYESLWRSSLLSTYATTEPWDDFADSLGYALLKDLLKGTYELDTQQGQSYDILAKLDAPVFARKREYLRQFLARTDLKYPKP